MQRFSSVSLVVAALLIVTLACSFTQDDEGDSSPATPTQAQFIVVTANPTLTPTPTADLDEGTDDEDLADNTLECNYQTGWPVYTVIGGDTLGTIAQRSGSTISQLVAANCLADADSLYVGQQLYVPQLPAPVVGQENDGLVQITPIVRNDGGWLVLAMNSVVTMSWPNAPTGAARVDFTSTPTGTNIADAMQVIATDTNVSDGAAIQWQVSGGLGHLQAIAYDASGRRIGSSVITNAYAER